MDYVFYDFETTGFNSNFDQPIQLAAILTDENFNTKDVINEKCRLKDGVIANPGALAAIKADISKLSNAQSFYEMMKKFYDKFSEWSPAIFIGYNSISFDERFLRSSFYQSLHEPYLTNTKINGDIKNSRADIYKIVEVINCLKLKTIKIPCDKNKKSILKLESVAKENNIEHQTAHDALSDVEATLGIAKLIKQNNEELWQSCLLSRSPEIIQQELINKNNFLYAILSRDKLVPISLISANPNNPKELAFFNLNHDPKEYANAKTSEIKTLIKEKIIYTVKTNNFPILLRDDGLIDQTTVKSDKDGYKRKAIQIKELDNFKLNTNQALVDKQDDYQVDQSSDYVEEQLFSAFTPNADIKRKKLFHITEDKKVKRDIIEQLEDGRAKEIANRILFSDYPDELSENKKNKMKNSIASKVFCNDDVPWCTLDKAKKELKKLHDSVELKTDKDYLTEIDNYLQLEEKKYKSYL